MSYGCNEEQSSCSDVPFLSVPRDLLLSERQCAHRVLRVRPAVELLERHKQSFMSDLVEAHLPQTDVKIDRGGKQTHEVKSEVRIPQSCTGADSLWTRDLLPV